MKTGGVAWRARPYSFLCFCELDREKGRRREPRVGKWKTKSRFPTLPTGPWKSRQHREVPTFPPPGFAPRGAVENQNQVSSCSAWSSRRRPVSLSNQEPKKKGKWSGKTVHFHAHVALEPSCSFMLILRLENASDIAAVKLYTLEERRRNKREEMKKYRAKQRARIAEVAELKKAA